MKTLIVVLLSAILVGCGGGETEDTPAAVLMITPSEVINVVRADTSGVQITAIKYIGVLGIPDQFLNGYVVKFYPELFDTIDSCLSLRESKMPLPVNQYYTCVPTNLGFRIGP